MALILVSKIASLGIGSIKFNNMANQQALINSHNFMLADAPCPTTIILIVCSVSGGDWSLGNHYSIYIC